MNKEILVAFADIKLKEDYDKLVSGKFEEKKLYEYISRAIQDIKDNPFCGIKIPKNLIPEKYVKKYNISNLWKYNLPNAWRLVYSIKTDQIQIVSMILEWFNHKDYEKRFNY